MKNLIIALLTLLFLLPVSCKAQESPPVKQDTITAFEQDERTAIYMSMFDMARTAYQIRDEYSTRLKIPDDMLQEYILILKDCSIQQMELVPMQYHWDQTTQIQLLTWTVLLHSTRSELLSEWKRRQEYYRDVGIQPSQAQWNK